MRLNRNLVCVMSCWIGDAMCWRRLMPSSADMPVPRTVVPLVKLGNNLTGLVLGSTRTTSNMCYLF